METETEKNLNDTEWENRVLCSDGNCIGIIGKDGKCKVCGLPYEGSLPFQSTPEADQDPEAEVDRVTMENPEQQSDSDEPVMDDDWEKRVLCSDGNCIGVIGPDGRCKECGKPYEKVDN